MIIKAFFWQPEKTVSDENNYHLQGIIDKVEHNDIGIYYSLKW